MTCSTRKQAKIRLTMTMLRLSSLCPLPPPPPPPPLPLRLLLLQSQLPQATLSGNRLRRTRLLARARAWARRPVAQEAREARAWSVEQMPSLIGFPWLGVLQRLRSGPSSVTVLTPAKPSDCELLYLHFNANAFVFHNLYFVQLFFLLVVFSIGFCYNLFFNIVSLPILLLVLASKFKVQILYWACPCSVLFKILISK